MKAIFPPWAKPGCTVLAVWEEPISSGTAEGVATWVRYKDSNGKEQQTIKWVKWK